MGRHTLCVACAALCMLCRASAVTNSLLASALSGYHSWCHADVCQHEHGTGGVVPGQGKGRQALGHCISDALQRSCTESTNTTPTSGQMTRSEAAVAPVRRRQQAARAAVAAGVAPGGHPPASGASRAGSGGGAAHRQRASARVLGSARGPAPRAAGEGRQGGQVCTVAAALSYGGTRAPGSAPRCTLAPLGVGLCGQEGSILFWACIVVMCPASAGTSSSTSSRSFPPPSVKYLKGSHTWARAR